jgi:hypothetical protein
VQTAHWCKVYGHFLAGEVTGIVVVDRTDAVGLAFKGEDEALASFVRRLNQGRQPVAVNRLFATSRPVGGIGSLVKQRRGEKGEKAAAGVDCSNQEQAILIIQGIDDQQAGILSGGQVGAAPGKGDFGEMEPVDQITVFTAGGGEGVVSKNSAGSSGSTTATALPSAEGRIAGLPMRL